MSRTFRYIQNDDVLKSFIKFKDSILIERPVVIARHGDYSLTMTRVSDNSLRLTILNSEKKKKVFSRTYDVDKTTDELVSRGTRHACQKMAELSDEEVNRKRLQIWKWYVLDWQEENIDSDGEILKAELMWDEYVDRTKNDVLDIEAFLHGDYLNLGNTLTLIEKYMKDPLLQEMFRKFAIEDIMEMTSEDTKDKSIADNEAKNQTEELKKHTYRFTVSVEATDKEHARQALLYYLAGDERIKVQK